MKRDRKQTGTGLFVPAEKKNMSMCRKLLSNSAGLADSNIIDIIIL